MAALLTDQFRIFSAKKFIKALEGPDATQSDDAAGTSRDRLYLFIGRPQTWDNENSPPLDRDWETIVLLFIYEGYERTVA